MKAMEMLLKDEKIIQYEKERNFEIFIKNVLRFFDPKLNLSNPNNL